MKSYAKDDRRTRAFNIIDGCQNIDEIQKAVEAYGYNDKKFKEANMLKENVRESICEKTLKHGEYHQAVANMNNCLKKAQDTFKAHVRVARIILKNSKELEVPRQCNMRQQAKFEAWLDLAYQFYGVVLNKPEWLDHFSRFNITAKDLESGKQLISAVVSARKRKDDLFQEAKNSTARSDDALNKIERWCADLVAIARMALGNDSALLRGLIN